MSGINFTLRLEPDEIEKMETQARAWGCHKSQVLKIALEGLHKRQINAEQMSELQHQLRILEAHFKDSNERQKRCTHLLLKVLKAPPEAEQALVKIFEGT